MLFHTIFELSNEMNLYLVFKSNIPSSYRNILKESSNKQKTYEFPIKLNDHSWVFVQEEYKYEWNGMFLVFRNCFPSLCLSLTYAHTTESFERIDENIPLDENIQIIWRMSWNKGSVSMKTKIKINFHFISLWCNQSLWPL